MEDGYFEGKYDEAVLLGLKKARAVSLNPDEGSAIDQTNPRNRRQLLDWLRMPFFVVRSEFRRSRRRIGPN
jgi:hypothetical protein